MYEKTYGCGVLSGIAEETSRKIEFCYDNLNVKSFSQRKIKVNCSPKTKTILAKYGRKVDGKNI